MAKAESWDELGNYNISWYTDEPDLYISTPKELAGIAYLINNSFTDFSGQTIHLTSDINLYGKQWVPIALHGNKTFRGSIDGQGHSISNVVIDDSFQVKRGIGFISEMENGTISSLTFNASIYSKDFCIGIVAAYAKDCHFKDLIVKGNICTISTKSYENSSFRQGGIVGISTNCSFTDVISEFEQYIEKGNKSGGANFDHAEIYAGGIIGSCGDITTKPNTYLRCESYTRFCNIIYGHKYDGYYNQDKPTSVFCGGIAGRDGARATYKSCLSKIYINDGQHLTGNYDQASFYTYGFGNISGRAENCVAIIDSYKMEGHEYSPNSGGGTLHRLMSYDPYDFYAYASYVNNDIIKSVIDVKDYIMLSGSSSFSKAQMNSQQFVDELNIYSRLHMNGEENWKIENGTLKIIHPKDNNTGLDNVSIDTSLSEDSPEYYTINGIRVKDISNPGIYIYKNGPKVKKVLIR